VFRRPMPRVVIESFTLVAHQPGNLAHMHHPGGPTGNDMEPIGSVFLPPKPYTGLRASFSCFILKSHAGRWKGIGFLPDYHCQSVLS
jgi:hypothetical protein